MDSVRKHAAINAKLKAMSSRFLSKEDYLNLLNETSIKGCAQYLKNNTDYSEVLFDENVSGIRRGTLEGRIKESIVRSIDKIMYYYNGDNKEFIKTFYAKYEIEDLKDLARDVYNVESIRDYESHVFIGKYSKADPDKVMSSKSVKDIIIALEGTVFDKYTKPLIDNNRKENLFRFEMTLDLAYYSILQEKQSKLSQKDQKAVKHIYGIIGDVLNMQWLYRGKKFYNIEPMLLLSYTINLYHTLSFKRIKSLCYANSVSDFIKEAKETDYDFLFKDDESTDIFMDRRIYRYLYYKLQSIDSKTNMNIVNTVIFILLLEFETKDIISIIEIVRYGMAVDEGKKYLIKNIG